MKISAVLGCLALALPFGGATPLHNKRHHELAHRANGDVEVHKRGYFPNARFTWYDVGEGACGQWNNPSDHIVALNVLQFGPGYPGIHCFKKIAIRVGGVTIIATIMDKCMGCPWGGLDFSPGLFSSFGPQSIGVLNGDWWFID